MADLDELYDALDVPDSRDFKFSDFEEYLEGDGKTFPYSEATVFNQNGYGACTRYGITHISNGENINEYGKHGKKYTQIDPLVVWKRSNKSKSLQEAMKQLKGEGLIKAYLYIDGKGDKGIEQCKKAIDYGLYIYTGSSNGDRTVTGKKKVYTTQRVRFAGHAFAIVGYDDSTGQFKCMNSFGTGRGDGGYFYMKYADLFGAGMYSKSAIVDVDNSSVFEDSIEKQRAKEIVRACKKAYENSNESKRKQKMAEIANWMRETYKFTDADL